MGNIWTVPSSSAIRLFWVLLFNSNDVTRWLSLPCYTKFEKVRLLCIYLDLGWFNNYQWQSGFITFSLIKWIWIRIKFEEEESFKINAEIFRHVLSGCKKCLVLNYSEDPSIFKFADWLLIFFKPELLIHSTDVTYRLLFLFKTGNYGFQNSSKCLKYCYI